MENELEHRIGVLREPRLGRESLPNGALLQRGDYRLMSSGFVVKGDDSRIVGRISGYGPGTFWYQLAKQPHDEPSVLGFKGRVEAFDAMLLTIIQREKTQCSAI